MIDFRSSAKSSLLSWLGRLFIGVAACLILYGHWVVIRAGTVFDIRDGTTYADLNQRWVSDFAAVPGHGWWIKSGILCFCGAIACLFKLLEPLTAKGIYWRRVLWWTIFSAQATGLVFVVWFDMNPSRYIHIETGWWDRLWGRTGGWVSENRSPSEWSARWYHQIGFRVFAGATFTTQILVLWSLIRSGMKSVSITLLTTAGLLLAALLFHSLGTLPGSFQRLMLGVMAAWLWICIGKVRTLMPQANSRS